MKKYIVVFITLVIVFLMIPLSALAFTPAENYPSEQRPLYPNDIFHSPRTVGDNKNWALISFSFMRDYPYYNDYDINIDKFYYIASDKPFDLIVDFDGDKSIDIYIVYFHDIQLINGFTDDWTYDNGDFFPLNRSGNLNNLSLVAPEGELFGLYNIRSGLVSELNFNPREVTSPTVIWSGDVNTSGSGFETDMLNGIMDDIKPGVNILLPANNYSQSQIDTISTTFTYKVPCADETMYDQINIKVDGYKKGTTDIDFQEFKVKDGYAYGLCKVSGDVGFGEGKEIKVTVTDPYGKKWYDKVTVHCYEGFVDEDEDGIDDRSFDDFWDSPANPINQEKPDISINDVASLFNGIKTFFEGLWGILPQPIYVVLIGGLMVLIAVGILRAVLG